MRTRNLFIIGGMVVAVTAVVIAVWIIVAHGGSNVRYENEKYGFSFRYPKDFSVQEFAEGDAGDVVLFQKAGEQNGFQVFIAPFDEDITLTAERIRKDVPNITMKNPQPVTIGRKAAFARTLSDARVIGGVAFVSESPAFGESFEIWFVHRGHLFQASAYRASEEVVRDVVRTWRFSD